MKIYLSCSSADLALAAERMATIRAMGHEIVYDWTASFNDNVLKEDWPALAAMDVDMVKAADCMVLWGQPTAGCYVELGTAIVDRVPVVWVMDGIDAYQGRHFFMYYHGLCAITAPSLPSVLAFVANVL